MKSDIFTVHFDDQRNAARTKDGNSEAESLDYSPLPRVTRRSLFMGVLVSMGGMV